MIKSTLLIAALISLAAPAYAEPSPKPSKEFQQTFKGCKWGQVKGETLSIWSFACDKKHGDTRLEAANGLSGFVLKSQDDETIAIQVFTKDKAAALDSILPAVQAASPGEYTDSCALVPMKSAPERYVLEPTGDAKTKWEAAETGGEPMDPPCGALGVNYVGDQYFEVLKGNPEIVVYYNMGSEIQIFDPKTLKITGKK